MQSPIFFLSRRVNIMIVIIIIIQVKYMYVIYMMPSNLYIERTHTHLGSSSLSPNKISLFIEILIMFPPVLCP